MSIEDGDGEEEVRRVGDSFPSFCALICRINLACATLRLFGQGCMQRVRKQVEALGLR